jgi:hypothetical protein
VRNSTCSANGQFGVRADQQLPGLGALTLTSVDLSGNAGGERTGDNVIVTVNP